jgi:5-amino-6-(5-phosphoribosylamino)uracil reductase
MASSVDGKIGPAGVERFVSITSKRDLQHLQEIRDQADGILFGAETFRTFPKVHEARTKSTAAHHFIMSRSLVLDLAAPLFQDPAVPVTIFSPSRPKKDWHLPRQVSLVHIPSSQNMLQEIVQHIQKLGVTSLLVEGGGHILNQFISAGLLEDLYLTLSPRIIGSTSAPGLTGSTRLSNPPRLQVLSTEQHHNEVFLHLGLNGDDQKA